MASMGAILARREIRQELRTQLHREFTRPVMVFTLNIPGSEKNSDRYIQAHKVGEKVLIETLREQSIETLRTSIVYGVCGREALFVARSTPRVLKELCVSIEESHPLGRIFDIDVYDTDGKALHRSEIGKNSRSCFLCEEPATECARSRRHETEDLLHHIDSRIDTFFKGPSKRRSRSSHFNRSSREL